VSEWHETTLGEEVNLITGFPFKSSHYTNNINDIPLIRGDNIVQGRLRWDGVKRWPTNDTTIDESYKLREGDVVLAMDRPWIEAGLKFAVISRFDLPCYLVQRVACIRGKDNLCSVFLRYLIASKDFTQHVLSVETGSAVPHISGSQIKEFIFQRPPLKEQKSIASILSSLDDKIDLLHRQNKTLEAMSETLFRQWFVEEAGDWEEGKLGDVIEIFDGKRIPLSSMERAKKKDGVLYPYYGAAKIMDYINDYIFDGEYILLGEDGTVRTDEGYPILQYATGKFWVNNHTHVLKAKPPYSNYFLWNYLSKKNIDGIVTGAVQPKINQGNLKALVFPCYPEELVKEYNKISEPMLTKINRNKEHIAHLEKLRDSLLPKLMSGDVRVA